MLTSTILGKTEGEKCLLSSSNLALEGAFKRIDNDARFLPNISEDTEYGDAGAGDDDYVDCPGE
ncbi:MAG: hypothetical protein HON76_08830 [Candidatus Scalindua sp.]|jgi:hypothetical protein|nr:hypothetical protein [Candidatus Scalindua sp.]MBT6562619.1 hypothetical protein [Candidatus Scalindua sp.]MBT7211916.1 hypothetical protein [Candidatus Scalindua sp.]